MEKANKVFRRSGIRLRSMKSGHALLKLIISDLKDSRKSYKSYVSNQETTWSDIVKWSSLEHNRGLREVIDNIVQLQTLWTDVQTQFLTALKKYQHQFETILESEVQLDKSRAVLSSCEQKETKLLKELRKANSSYSSVDDLKQIEEKLEDVKHSIQRAQIDVASNTTENESVKMVLMKEGLINLSEQYIGLADKTAMIFKAQRTVAATLPDAHTYVQDIRYNGNEECAAAVDHVKRSLRSYISTPGQSTVPSQPPPYFPPSPPHDTSATATPYFENLPRYYNTSPASSAVGGYTTVGASTSSQPFLTGWNYNNRNYTPGCDSLYPHLQQQQQQVARASILSSAQPDVAARTFASSTAYYDTPPPENSEELPEQMLQLSVNR